MDEITQQAREETREVMEYFGRAVHTANIFEYSLMLLLTLNATKNESSVNAGRWESLFEAGRKKTLGRLVKRAIAELNVAEQNISLLDRGLDRRNYLVHKYMLENDQRLFDPKERMEMVKELDAIRKDVRAGDKVIVRHCK